MKFVSTMALGLALAFGATATLGTPAMAKEKAAKPASFNLSLRPTIRRRQRRSSRRPRRRLRRPTTIM